MNLPALPGQYRQLAQIFTRSILERIARDASADVALKALKMSGISIPLASKAPLTWFDRSLDILQAHYRCEYVYKAAIADRVVFGRHSPTTASLQVELPVGRSIVDVAVFNGTSTAYEIKTEFDSNRRLATQTPNYLKAFERVYVVTHPDLALRYLEIVDERVGVLSLCRRGRLAEARKATRDINRIDPSMLFRMLRREEYIHAVEQIYGAQPTLPNGYVSAHFGKLFASLSPSVAHSLFVEAMRRRTTDEDTVQFVSSLPKSLRVLGFSTPLSGNQRQRLLKGLKEKTRLS